MDDAGRTCNRTGLRLFRADVAAWRVATTVYGPVSPLERLAGEERGSWNRYDTPGSTIYLSDGPQTAFAEMLSGFKRRFGSADPLQKEADFLGITLSEFLSGVAGEWAESQAMNTGCVPRHWRDRRLLYQVRIPDKGWWIDIEHPESMAAIGEAVGVQLAAEADVEALTLGVLHGENRVVTTMIAVWLRARDLDDGSAAAGIRFTSKHGGDHCWGYWLRQRDLGLAEDGVIVDVGIPIELHNPDLSDVGRRFNLQIL